MNSPDINSATSHCLKFIVLLASLLGSATICAKTQPPSEVKPAGLTSSNPTQIPVARHGFTAIYQAAFKGFPLQATHRLEKSGDDWYFSSIASGFFGQIEENSTFAYTTQGIVPRHYLYQRSVLGHDNTSEITFNTVDKVANGSKDDKSFTVKLAGGEIDQGSYALALRDDLARGIKDPCYQVVDNRNIERYCFQVTGHEALDTALGKLDTVVVERVRKSDSPRRTRFWFAPSLDYTIAKLEHQEVKGETAYSLEITYYRNETNNTADKKSSKP